MFVILTYDIAQKRNRKVFKICQRYLPHEQKSVFEGELTKRELGKLKQEIKKVIDPENDSVNIYEFTTLKYSSKERLGLNQGSGNIL